MSPRERWTVIRFTSFRVGRGFASASIGALVLMLGTEAAFAHPRLEFEAGPTWTTLLYREELPVWENGGRLLFAGGANLEFPIRSSTALQTGLRYLPLGNSVKIDLAGYDHFRVTQHYVALPLRLRLRPTPARRFFVAAGPEAAILVNARISTDAVHSPFFDLPESSTNIRKNLQPVVLLWGAEADFEFTAGRRIARAGLRYTYGITGAAKKEDWLSDWHTQSVEGLLGLVW